VVFKLPLSSVEKTLAKKALCIVSKNTRQKSSLPSVKKHSPKKLFVKCQKDTRQKDTGQRVSLLSVFLPGFFVWHTTKSFFAESSKKNTRQIV
jgi:hypothetical protein